MVKFSCIITVYSGTVLEYFKEAFYSTLHQTVSPNEIIITIDGPVYSELEGFIDSVVTGSAPTVIRKLQIPENKGAGPARNEAIRGAENEWIAIMDCDDLCDKTRFEKQVGIAIKYPDVDFISTLSEEYSNDFSEGNLIALKKCPEFSDAIKKRLNYNCCITNPSIFFRKSNWEAAGGYASFKFLNEDHYFFLNLCRLGCKFYCIQEPLVKVRIGKDQSKRRSGLKLFMQDYRFRTLCYRKGLIDFKGYLVLLPIFFRRLTPSFLLPYLHKAWRAI